MDVFFLDLNIHLRTGKRPQSGLTASHAMAKITREQVGGRMG